MSQPKRFAVIIGLHQRRLAEARRHIGRLESAFNESREQIEILQEDQLQAAAGINYLMYDQYLGFCAHLQSKINALLEQQQSIERAIAEAWDAFRDIRVELQTFEKLQERYDSKDRLKKQRSEQRAIVDGAVRDWLEASA